MTLHPLTTKGGAFVLKFGLVFKRKRTLIVSFFLLVSEGIRDNEQRIPPSILHIFL